MAKIVISTEGTGALPRSKGSFYVRFTKHGPVACKWPQRRVDHNTYERAWQYRQFAAAAHAASNAIWLDVGTAEFLTKGRTNPPRDLLTQAIYGKLYEFVFDDGTIPSYNPHSPPPLPKPPNPFDAEEQDMLEWTNPGNVWSATASTSAYNCKSTAFVPRDTYLLRNSMYRCNLTSGQRARLQLAVLNDTARIDDFVFDLETTAYMTGNQILEFPLNVTLYSGVYYALIASRPDVSGTTALGITDSNSAKWNFPATLVAGGRNAVASMNVGDTIGLVTTGAFNFGLNLTRV